MSKREPPNRKWSIKDLPRIVDEAEQQPGPPPSIPPRRLPVETPSKPLDEAMRILDSLRAEAEAGMTTEALADKAGVSRLAVREWRRARGVPEPAFADVLENVRAVSLLPADNRSALHYVRELGLATELDSPVPWEPTEYVIHSPLNYTEFTRHVYFLHTRLGSDVQTLAQALGVRERDIELAIAIERRHLEQHGRTCRACAYPVDPRYGLFCSVTCQQKPRVGPKVPKPVKSSPLAGMRKEPKHE